MTKNDCCLCGLPYERIGNNPAPLSLKGRCCDACNEVVIMARIDPAKVLAEIERVEAAIFRQPHDQLHQITIAAVCAMHGPVLLAEKQRVMDELMKEL